MLRAFSFLHNATVARCKNKKDNRERGTWHLSLFGVFIRL